ncbi:hypothetical protein [Methyloversatilis thermotolerans]|uniref:hypothetical protein n=1 Tax=Methyloversatilis thermotolerans TaxID=1346290 RepID=UPI0003A95546|nr:hypothetical protein [Methyloversatilis thermotolerans]
MKKRKALFNALCSICLSTLTLPAAAADQEDVIEARAEATYDAARKNIDLDYKAAMDRCDKLDGDAENVCEKEAEAARKNALADAKVALKTEKARAEQVEERNEAELAAAQARCESLEGSARKACMKDAELKYDD